MIVDITDYLFNESFNHFDYFKKAVAQDQDLIDRRNAIKKARREKLITLEQRNEQLHALDVMARFRHFGKSNSILFKIAIGKYKRRYRY